MNERQAARNRQITLARMVRGEGSGGPFRRGALVHTGRRSVDEARTISGSILCPGGRGGGYASDQKKDWRLEGKQEKSDCL